MRVAQRATFVGGRERFRRAEPIYDAQPRRGDQVIQAIKRLREETIVLFQHGEHPADANKDQRVRTGGDA